MFGNLLDYEFKINLINHYESTLNEIDVKTELELLKSKHLESELHQTRQMFIRHVNSCKIKNFDLIKNFREYLNKNELNSFCLFLKNDYYSKIQSLIGILIETDFYISKSQIELIKLVLIFFNCNNFFLISNFYKKKIFLFKN